MKNTAATATRDGPRRSTPGRRITGAAQTRLLVEHRLLSALQWLFEKIVWLLHQRKVQAADKLANEGIEL